MAQVVTFSPSNRRIIVNDTFESNISVNISEIYSEWKVWVSQSDNAKFPPAFNVIGGNPLTSVKELGFAYFLINNWRIRPSERSHKLNLVGDLFTDPFGFSPVVSTVGNYNVVVEYETSALTSISRLDQILLTKIARDAALSVALAASK